MSDTGIVMSRMLWPRRYSTQSVLVHIGLETIGPTGRTIAAGHVLLQKNAKKWNTLWNKGESVSILIFNTKIK